MEDRFFKFAVLVSLLLHFGLFLKLYLTPKRDVAVQEAPELAYHFDNQPEKVVPDHGISSAVLMESSVLEQAGGIIKGEGPDSISDLLKNSPDAASQFKVFERAPEKVKGLKVTKEVSIPVLKSEKIDTPGYAMYTGIIRDRIRERAYVNFVKFSGGDVYLTFVIRSDGKLVDVQVLQNRTQASEALCSVGIQSIREASPFPSFPKDLNYPELTFNIQISFQSHEGD